MQGLSTLLVAVIGILSMMVAGHLWLSSVPRRGVLAAVCGIFGLQAFLLVLHLLAPSALPSWLRSVASVNIPPLVYLGFLISSPKRAGNLLPVDAFHLAPAAGVLLTVMLFDGGAVLDWGMVLVEAGYGVALLSVDRAGNSQRRGLLLGSAAILGGMAVIDTVIVFEMVNGGQLIYSWGLRTGIGLMLIITFGMFVVAWRDPEWFSQVGVHASNRPSLPPPPEASHSNEFVSQEAEVICKQLELILSTERAYAEFGLSLADVAKRLGVPVRKVSLAVNQVHKKGFRTLVNDFKVAEAARLLSEPSMSNQSITDVMFEAGFQTKSNFNKEFIDRVGFAPGDYRKQHIAVRSKELVLQPGR